MINAFLVAVIFSMPGNADVYRFIDRFYQARLKGDTGFIRNIGTVEDSLKLTYPLFEKGDFKYTGFTVKCVEKMDSLTWKVKSIITEGYGKWNSIGTIEETLNIVNLRGRWKILFINQVYKNTVIPIESIGDTVTTYLLDNKKLVLLNRPSPNNGVSMNVHYLKVLPDTFNDTCPSWNIIPDFFPPIDGTPKEKVVTLKHNSLKFCYIEGGEEGAAGHIYRYYYFIPLDFKDVVFSFMVENTNCDNYDERYQETCKEENSRRNAYPYLLLGTLRMVE